ncbi:hypothetical protein ACFW4M_35770 [Streptomyces sp. NPDC058794]
MRACADAVGVSVLRELDASMGGKLLWAQSRSRPEEVRDMAGKCY